MHSVLRRSRVSVAALVPLGLGCRVRGSGFFELLFNACHPQVSGSGLGFRVQGFFLSVVKHL